MYVCMSVCLYSVCLYVCMVLKLNMRLNLFQLYDNCSSGSYAYNDMNITYLQNFSSPTVAGIMGRGGLEG